uniref:Protein kinase domain-containing protein n=1 Tax=Strongyloides stercoralis TaxID=6248 RepID=A0A0K0DV91_STRER
MTDIVDDSNYKSYELVKPSDKSLDNEKINNVKHNELSGKKVNGIEIHNLLGEGGFGCVYKCTMHKRSGETLSGAFKAEMNKKGTTTSNGLVYECSILRKLEAEGNMYHFTNLYINGQRPLFSFMVLQLVGPNLYDICTYLPDEKFEYNTFIRVAYQTLESIQALHNIGYLHNDLKPANFAIGDKSHETDGIIVYMLDFGLSREYGSKENPIKNVYKKPKNGIEYTGTISHCSPNAHQRKELGRRDDMYAWIFLCMDFYNELPWRTLEKDEEIEEMKLKCTYETYCKFLPKGFHCLLKHIDSLGVYDKPDYNMCFNEINKLMKEAKIKMEDPYQWELLPIEAKKSLNIRLEPRKNNAIKKQVISKKKTAKDMEGKARQLSNKNLSVKKQRNLDNNNSVRNANLSCKNKQNHNDKKSTKDKASSKPCQKVKEKKNNKKSKIGLDDDTNTNKLLTEEFLSSCVGETNEMMEKKLSTFETQLKNKMENNKKQLNQKNNNI